MTTRVLMVCLGNICRSPTAEAALRDMAAKRGVDVTVTSAGTGGWHEGQPADARMRDAATAGGLDLSHHVARQVDVKMMRDADLILAMDRTNLLELQRIADERRIATPIRLFRAIDPEVTDDRDVPDPYYGGEDGFTTVVSLCVRIAAHLLDTLTDHPTEASGDVSSTEETS